MVERLGLGVVKAISPLLGEDLSLAVVQVLVNGAGVLHRCIRVAFVLASKSASFKLKGLKCQPIPSLCDDRSTMPLFMLSGAPCPWVVFVNAGVEVKLPGAMEGSAGGLYCAAAETESSCGFVVPLGSSFAALVVSTSKLVLLPWSGSEELYCLGGWTSA